ncbi:putative vancomycin resistance protein [Deinococcus peraridilitoris DSM 19664]|uniref:Putative vancomycin resistance protein n=1 Tax=Deinococcus peraridilitoris (strain DSM 19664 / LMG 22246 / CIP 109416 / KR-200) TaxID=937777 RepID=L0A0R5_DEIPD|nr:putative vancomycin resistance protein [Deinococcus peraridilitoris DSM 19664]
MTPAARAVALSVVFTETVPTALNGQKIYETRREIFNLSEERSKILRAGAKMTLSLRQDVEQFARRLEREAQDARFEYAPISGEWRLVMRGAVKVDLDATLAAVESALRDPATRRVNVVYSTIRPARTLDFFLQKGITSLLGEGSTSYAGSSKARMANIHLGTRNFQDVLLDKNAFSFNQMVGPVSAARGYLPGLVIAGERTASGVGGGICQVSTTVFRALYAAGLPVRERQNHSYQVHYYDPQGLDATIYQPNLDLKFDNDTGASLWFQATWDDRTARLNIQVFGRPRLETVEVGAPRVLATQAVPPERLITDPSLAPGRRVQVDWAAPGATIEVQRVFRRGGEVVRSEVLRSVYRPWPNIYLVGPQGAGTAER